MSTINVIYTTGTTLYGKTVKDSLPWVDDTATITEDGTFAGVYPTDTGFPFIYLQAGGSPDASDTFLFDSRDQHYGNVTEGDLFHSKRFHSWDWSNATLGDKVKALYTATLLIDMFNYFGSKVDSDQNLEFPRQCVADDGTITEINGGTIPVSVEEAAYLISEALLSGRDPELDFEALRVKVETFGPVRTEFATDKGPPEHVSNMIPSPTAWARLKPWLEISTSFDYNKG